MKIYNAGIQGGNGIKLITAHVGGDVAQIALLKRPTTSDGTPWYKDARLNRLAQINGGRFFGEKTMQSDLESGLLMESWLVPDEEIFGANADYLAQFIF